MRPSWAPSSSTTRTCGIRIIWLMRRSLAMADPFELGMPRFDCLCAGTQRPGRSRRGRIAQGQNTGQRRLEWALTSPDPPSRGAHLHTLPRGALSATWPTQADTGQPEILARGELALIRSPQEHWNLFPAASGVRDAGEH